MKMMKPSFSILALFGKMFLLGCFSFFGGQCGVVEAHVHSPCHESAQEQAIEENKTKPCGQCEHSISAWSEPIVYASLVQKEVPLFPPFLLEEEALIANVTGGIIAPAIVPPDDLENQVFKRIAKSTLWRNSDCFSFV